MLKTVQSAAIGLAMWLVPASIAGLVACLFFDLFGEDGLLSFAIWLVLGIFTGLFVFNTGAAWLTGAEDPANFIIAPPLGLRLFGAQVLMLTGLSLLLYWLFWRDGWIDEVSVPGSMPHTLFFFAAVTGGMWLGRLMSVWEFEAAQKAADAARGGGKAPRS